MGLRDDAEKRAYFSELWDWFLEGGSHHVAAYLATRDVCGWSASNGQRKTEAHRTVVISGMTGDHWLQDALDEIESAIGNIDLIRADWIVQMATRNQEMKPAEVRAKMNYAITRQGYEILKSSTSSDGRHRIGRKNVVVYRRGGSGNTDFSALDRDLF
jgi:hypothetical protein